MVLKWQKTANNPKMIDLFWEGSLVREVYRFLFVKELECIPEKITYEELFSHLAQIELKAGKRYAIWLLSRRSLLSSELKQKLLAKAISEESVEKIIDFCVERGYLDDTAQANRWIEVELKKGRSRRAIHSKLIQQKRIDPALLDSLKEISDEEALDRYLAKQSRKLQNADDEGRRKIMQKLCRQGFCMDLIRNKINGDN